MAFDAQRHRQTTARVDHAGVLAGAHQHVRTLGRQAGQMDPARLVGAMLAPHDRVHGQLEMIGLPAKQASNHLGFVVGESEGSMDIAGHDHEPTGPGDFGSPAKMDVRYCLNGNEINTP